MVFKNKNQQGKAGENATVGWVWPFVRFLVGLLIAIGLSLIPYESFKLDSVIFLGISQGLTVIQFFIAMMTRHTWFRILPGAQLGG